MAIVVPQRAEVDPSPLVDLDTTVEHHVQSAAGRQIVALQGQGSATPGAVVTLDPETLQPTGSASVQGDGYPMFFTATPDAAYVVEARSTGTQVEDLVRVDVARERS